MVIQLGEVLVGALGEVLLLLLLVQALVLGLRGGNHWLRREQLLVDIFRQVARQIAMEHLVVRLADINLHLEYLGVCL